jgi:hypothetical protein
MHGLMHMEFGTDEFDDSPQVLSWNPYLETMCQSDCQYRGPLIFMSLQLLSVI